MKSFNKGERVCSNVCGYYLGLPGTIKGPSQAQYNMDTRYIIELDIGRTIALAASRIKPLKE